MLGDDWLKLSGPELYEAFDAWLKDAANSNYWSPNNPTGQRIHWKCFNTASSHPSKKTQFDSPGCYLFGWGAGFATVIPRYVGETGKNTLKGRLKDHIPTKHFIIHPSDSKIRECALATWLTKNCLAQVNNGWKALPNKFDNLILKHHKNYGPGRAQVTSKIRGEDNPSNIVKFIKDQVKPALSVRRGEDYAKLGIADIWFALFPIAFEEETTKLKATIGSSEEAISDPIFLQYLKQASPKEIQEIVARSNVSKIKGLENNLIDTVRRWNHTNGRTVILNRQG